MSNIFADNSESIGHTPLVQLNGNGVYTAANHPFVAPGFGSDWGFFDDSNADVSAAGFSDRPEPSWAAGRSSSLKLVAEHQHRKAIGKAQRRQHHLRIGAWRIRSRIS